MKLERTRASEAKPAMAMPMWESIPMTFFWYDDNSSAFRYITMICFPVRSSRQLRRWILDVETYLEGGNNCMRLAHNTNNNGALFDSF